MHKPDLLHIAIVAAGGRERIAKHFNIHKQTVSNWKTSKSLPSYYIEKLCALGEHIIKPEQLLAYIDWARGEKQ